MEIYTTQTSPQHATRKRMPAGTFTAAVVGAVRIADTGDFGFAGEVCALRSTARPAVRNDVDAAGPSAWSPPV